MIEKLLTFDDVNIVPQYSTIKSRKDIDTKTQFSRDWTIEIPIVSAPMETVTGVDMALEMNKLGGVGVLHRFDPEDIQAEKVHYIKKNIKKTNLPVVAAIGVTGNYKNRADALIKAGADVLLLDVAHGHHSLVKDALKWLKEEFFDINIVAGNVSTSDGAFALEKWGADAIRFGQGNGSLCETRIRTGIGIPQISGLLSACEHLDIPVIADGGIRYIGDCAKALGAGARTVMLGSLLAGTKETPGEIAKIGIWPNEQLYKKYRGAASLESKQARGESKNVEGNSKLIPYKGKIKRILSDIDDGIRSSFSYVGANNIYEFHESVEFVEVTAAGTKEGTPHLLG